MVTTIFRLFAVGSALFSAQMLHSQSAAPVPAAASAGSFTPVKRAAGEPASIRFRRLPESKRVSRQGDIYLGGDFDILSEVVVVDDAGRAVPAAVVVLRVRSAAGSLARAQATADRLGRAPLRARFKISPGSLQLTAQACLIDNPGVCTVRAPLSLRDRFDLVVDVQVGWSGARTPTPTDPGDGRVYVPVLADSLLQSVVRPRAQLNVWESERNFRYRRLSVYGEAPVLFQNRALVSILGTDSLGSQFGVGDYETGVELQLDRRLFLNAAYNGRTGAGSAVDSFREIGRPRPLHLSDGFASFELGGAIQKSLSQRTALFLQQSSSLALPRQFSEGGRGQRGPYHRVVAGLWRRTPRGRFGWRLWAAYSLQGETTLTSNAQARTVAAARNDYVAGVSFSDLRSGPATTSVGLYVGGIGGGREYLGVSFDVRFRDLSGLQ